MGSTTTILSSPERTSHESQWTFRHKTNELEDLKSASHRSRFVAKGYSQVQGLHYFKNYAPVASFITIRLLFALTSIPDFKFTVNAPKDTEIDVNTFIAFTVTYTA